MLKNLKSNFFSKIAAVVAILTIFVASFAIPCSAADSSSSLNGTDWVFHDTVEPVSIGTPLPANFYTYSSPSSRIACTYLSWTQTNQLYMTYGGPNPILQVYTDGVWSSDSYRRIHFDSVHVDYASALAAMLEDSAYKCDIAYIDGQEFIFPVGSSWANLVSSDVNSSAFNLVFSLNGQSVLFGSSVIPGVQASDKIDAERYYSTSSDNSNDSFGFFHVLTGITHWVTNSFNDIWSVFYIEGEGLTLLGSLAIAGLSIAIGFLIIGVVQSFLKLRS